MQALVSIIIPTYNRAHLIGETIDSIISQTYTNWECIIVDDGSTDNTIEVVTGYVNRDNRIRLFKRPDDKPKGANACRNFGFDVSIGEYIIWFDSDDLMLENKIYKHIFLIQESKCDFSIVKFKNFSNTNLKLGEDLHKKNAYNLLNAENFIKSKFFFGTIDFLAKKSVLQGYSFNEYLHSGQEFHFFSIFLVNHSNGIYSDEILSLRRIHKDSIQQILINERLSVFENRFTVYEKIYQDLETNLSLITQKYLIKKILTYSVYKSIFLKSKTINFKLVNLYKKKFSLLNFTLIYSILLITFYSKNYNILFKGKIKRFFYKL